ncbi:MAG: endonuclease [Gammaproteobacteria bacterium]|nr:MAG: endonuclease [Gammaproteobacteria bacterium]
MIKIDNIIINTTKLSNIANNSIGIIKAINGKNAMVLFVGLNKILRVDFDNIRAIDAEHTGKGYDKKICNICHILKTTEEFDVNQTDAKGQKTTRPSCKECRKNIDGVKLTAAEKNKMNKVKPGKGSIFECPICLKTTIVGITANLVRDHDHETGKGREWICDSCNTGLGRFKDDTKFLERVISYLEKHKSDRN